MRKPPKKPRQWLILKIVRFQIRIGSEGIKMDWKTTGKGSPKQLKMLLPRAARAVRIVLLAACVVATGCSSGCNFSAAKKWADALVKTIAKQGGQHQPRQSRETD